MGTGRRGSSEVRRSLEGDLGALRLELLLRLVGGFLVRVLENSLRRGLDEVLRLLQAQAGQLAHDLDDLDLLATVGLENDVERVLLLLGRRGGGTATGTRGGRDRDRRGGGDVERLLELLHELRKFDQRHLLERVKKLGSAQLR